MFLVYTPKAEFFLEQRPANIVGTMQFPGSVVVKDLCKNARMSIEEVFAFRRVKLGPSSSSAVLLAEARQPGVKNISQSA